MATDTAGFRRVLHEWARRQLEEKSHHVGPFEIVDVRMAYDPGFGGSDVTPSDPSITDIQIGFRHGGFDCQLPDYVELPCRAQVWGPYDSETTVSLLNELLAIADEKP